jgi:hypothetical protein
MDDEERETGRQAQAAGQRGSEGGIIGGCEGTMEEGESGGQVEVVAQRNGEEADSRRGRRS